MRVDTSRVAKLQALVEADGANQLAHFMLGVEYLNAGMYSDAAGELRRCVELNPDYTAAWRWLGEAWEKAGVLKEAAAAYRTGIRSAVNSADLEASMEIEKSLSRLPAEFQEP